MLRFRWLVLGLGLFLLGVLTGAGLMTLRARGQPVPASIAAPERRLEATIFLPLTGNPRQPFSEKEWHDALSLLVADFGGATLGLPQEGYWRDGDGKLQKEPIRPVIVSFAPERLERFRQLVNEVGRRLGQEEVYVRFEEPRVELLPVRGPRLEKDR